MGFIHRTHFLSLVLLSLFLIITVFITRTCQFNLETRAPVVKEGPPGSYFGFSVAEHISSRIRPRAPYSTSKLLVGAPIHQLDSLPYNRTGSVFSCPFTSFYDDCTTIDLETLGTDTSQLKDNEWLGVTVRSQGAGGQVAACAHRYKERTATEISPIGKCFLLNPDLTAEPTEKEWMPCKGKGQGKEAFGYCQAGTGLAITESRRDVSDSTEYILGAPGAGDWRGAMISSSVDFKTYYTQLRDESVGVELNSYFGFSAASGYFSEGKLSYVGGAPRADISGAVVILHKVEGGSKSLSMTKVLNSSHPYSSFGYDVAAADVNGDGYDDLIVGAPMYFDRKTEAGGAVYVYLNDDQMGSFDGEPIFMSGPRDSRFGMAVAGLGDLNKDGYEDFAVGAPYENDGEGAVYIYMGNKMTGVTQPAAQKITPRDLPTELHGAMVPNITFGYSLSGGLDLDGNDFPDLLVGAVDSDAVVALRARPVINVTATLTVSPDELDAEKNNCGNKRCFNVTLCAKYVSSSFNFDEEIELIYDVKAETIRLGLGLSSRVYFDGADPSHTLANQTLILQPQTAESEVCSKPHTAYLKDDLNDIFRSIPIRIEYRLRDDVPAVVAPGEALPLMSRYAMFDQGVVTTIATECSAQELAENTCVPVPSVKVEFTKDCALDDGKCITDLHLKASFILPPNSLGVRVMKVGLDNQLRLDVKLDNMAEEAYDAKLLVEFPTILDFNGLESGASERIRYGCGEKVLKEDDNATYIVTCKLGNPYPRAPAMCQEDSAQRECRNVTERFVMRFDATLVPPDQGSFMVNLNVTSTNPDSNLVNNRESLKVEVESVTDLNIDGLTLQEQYLFGGIIRGESAIKREEEIGPLVVQQWTVFAESKHPIYNSGPASVAGATVTIGFPYEVMNGKWLLYMVEEPQFTVGTGSCVVDYEINELKVKTCGDNCTTDFRSQRGSYNEEEDDYFYSEQRDTSKVVLDCQKNTARCYNITCNLGELTDTTPNNEATIVIRSRLWNATFMEDYLYAEDIKVRVHGSVEMKGESYIIQTNTRNDKDFIVFQVIPPTISSPQAEPVAWWIILLAVLGGILLLILLIFILWKVGFFRRQGRGQGGPFGFFERKTGYKYATVTQKQSGAKVGTEKTAYYDEMYNYNSS